MNFSGLKNINQILNPICFEFLGINNKEKLEFNPTLFSYILDSVSNYCNVIFSALNDTNMVSVVASTNQSIEILNDWDSEQQNTNQIFGGISKLDLPNQSNKKPQTNFRMNLINSIAHLKKTQNKKRVIIIIPGSNNKPQQMNTE